MRLVLVLVALALPAQAGPRPGKVVRIERRTKKLFGNPRYCAFSLGDQQAYCYGKKPDMGEKIHVLDMHHTLGTVRVDNVEPLGACAQAASALWLAHTVVDSGDLVTPNDSQVAAVIDVAIDPKGGAHMVKADRVPGDRPNVNVDQVVALDLDGDSNPDLEFILFACDDQNNPPTATSASTGQCMEAWYANGHTFEHLRTDRIAQNCL
jgi:hypothetical protein